MIVHKQPSTLNRAQEIYRQSLRALRADPDYPAIEHHPSHLHPVLERMAHACGRCDFFTNIVSQGHVFEAIQEAIRQEQHVLSDSNSTVAAILKQRLPLGSQPLCLLDQVAQANHRTRSAQAVDLWKPMMSGAIVIIGQNPSALRALTYHLKHAWPLPAAIIACPVGYVDAPEAKEEFIDFAPTCPWLVIRGRFGGSAIAAAAFNACLVPLC